MSVRIIQVRPSRNPRWQKQGGWVAFEAKGVSPVFCGEHGRAHALSYAKQRAGYGRAEIQVFYMLYERFKGEAEFREKFVKPVT
jgi:hypothetical protein